MPVYKSATLAPGETYILPPGATIVSASNSSILASENNCATLKLEDLKCYILYVLANSESNPTFNSQTNVWEAGTSPNSDNVHITSLNVAGISYPLNIGGGDYGDMFIGTLQTFITNNSTLNGIFVDTSVASDDDGNHGRGGIASLCFKTIPSVASSIYIEVTTSLVSPAPGSTSTVRIYPVAYEDYNGLAKCGCSLSAN